MVQIFGSETSSKNVDGRVATSCTPSLQLQTLDRNAFYQQSISYDPVFISNETIIDHELPHYVEDNYPSQLLGRHQLD